jgi:anaerobic selenocysteine-containing dehydrogenase
LIDAATGTHLWADRSLRPQLEAVVEIRCRPALALLKDIAARYSPERSEEITWVPAETVRRAARMFVAERPSCGMIHTSI